MSERGSFCQQCSATVYTAAEWKEREREQIAEQAEAERDAAKDAFHLARRRADDAEAREDAMRAVVEAAQDIRRDLSERARLEYDYIKAKEKNPDAVPVVACGDGVWGRLCDALDNLATLTKGEEVHIDPPVSEETAKALRAAAASGDRQLAREELSDELEAMWTPGNRSPDGAYVVAPVEPTPGAIEAMAKPISVAPDVWDDMIDDAIDNYSGELPAWGVEAKKKAHAAYAAMLASLSTGEG